MLNTPKWIVDLLANDNFACPHCKNQFKPEYIKACGVRLSFRNASKQVLYVEYHCADCEQQPTLLELYDLGFDEFAFMVLEDIENDEMENLQERSNQIRSAHGGGKAQKRKKDAQKKNVQKHRSKISQKDVDNARAFLDKCEYHNDFLDVLGISSKATKKKVIRAKKDNENKS